MFEYIKLSLYICLVQRYNTTQDMKTATILQVRNFRKFINDCYVEHSINDVYNVVSNVDEEIYIGVRSLGNNAYEIVENEHFNIDSDAKREMVFLRMDQYMEDNRPVDYSGYEHPNEAGNIYSQAI